jgi:hypothetical protein
VRGTHYVRIVLLTAACAAFTSCLGPPLVISPATLPNAVEGQHYSASLNTSESRSIEWDITAGSLPPGIVVDSATGALGGTPTIPGTFDFTVAVAESFPPRTGSRAYTLEVLPQLTVQFAPPPARVNQPYEYTPLIEGGVPPYDISIVGLPGGLSSDPVAGTISGTPLAENAGLRLVLDITDSGDPQQSDSAHATLVVHPLAISITTTELPIAPVNHGYTAQVQATNGRQPFAWSITAGVLPAGLRLDQSSGKITGTPTSHANTETFTVSVTDSDTPASTDSRELKIVVPVIITTTSLPAGHAEQAYDASVGAAAGLPPYTWTITAGHLPSGLTLNHRTGVISGTPGASTAGQTFDFTMAVTDSDTPPMSAAQELSIQILP